MGLLTSNTGLMATDQRTIASKPKTAVELKCDVSPAPFMLRPFAALYNPFSHRCSILCNHPANVEARDIVNKAKGAWNAETKLHMTPQELEKLQISYDNDKSKTVQDIVTEDMFRRYTDTDSRPHTPAPTLASGKSRGSRRCLTPDQAPQRTPLVLDLRRSHSQETLYYRGYSTSELTSAPGASAANSTLPSLQLTDSTHARLIKGPCEQLPPLASPLVLAKRALPAKEAANGRNARKNQLKALNLNKPVQKKSKAAAAEAAQAQLSRVEEEAGAGAEEAGEVRRRGRRRRKGRQSTDRLTSAGLVATAAQDPETQIAGIGSDSHNPSSRGSIAPTGDDSPLVLPALKVPDVKKIDSFLDEDILKYLHREVDEKSIETEFDTKRRYVLEEALRTRPSRAPGEEMLRLLRDMRDNTVSLGDWLHVPGVSCRRNARFSLPLDSAVLQTLNPMKYVARYVMPKKSKQLLYLTVLQRFRPDSYKMPVQLIAEGVKLMMGGGVSDEQVAHFKSLMDWDGYEEQQNFTDDIKLTLARSDSEHRLPESGDAPTERTIKYRTWCGICAVCERMYGRFNSREQDPPDGMELSDFAMLEMKLAIMKVDSGLVEILNVIRTR